MGFNTGGERFDNVEHLKRKTNKELDDLIKWWEDRSQDERVQKTAREQIAIIRMIRAERLGKK